MRQEFVSVGSRQSAGTVGRPSTMMVAMVAAHAPIQRAACSAFAEQIEMRGQDDHAVSMPNRPRAQAAIPAMRQTTQP